MLKNLLLVPALLATVACTQNLPTIDTVGNGKLYRMTYIQPSDFHPDGTLRKITEYNLMVEDAPCTVLDSYKETPVYRDQFYSTDTASGMLLLTCRKIRGAKYRLVVLGSSKDCETRWWQMEWSIQPFYQKLAKLCNKNYTTFAGLAEGYEQTQMLSLFKKD